MTDTRDPSQPDVVIVGAGPTGMTAAALLAARGIRVTVLEARAGTSDEPKAISIDDEALRTYQQAGIIRDIVDVIVPGTGTRYYDASGEPVFQARAAVPYRLGHPFKNPFAQPDLERALAGALLANELVDLRYGRTVTELVPDDEGVTVSADGPDGPEIVRARFVLGADGGRSIVREEHGFGMTGRSYPDVWLVADTLEDHCVERYGMHHGDPARPHVIVPGQDGRCRYEFRLFEGEGVPGDEPDVELIRRLVAPYRELEPQQIERAVNYRFNAVNADHYRRGRLFVLGDAAHMMPPFAGQGLNSGIRDAANLAWKLAEVLQGRAPDALLDTYEPERKPHAAAIIAQSVRLGSVVMTTSPRVAAHRDRLVREALATPDGRAFYEEMRYRPLARHDSALTLTDGAGVVVGQPLVFVAATHESLRLDDAVGSGWTLFGVDVDPGAWGAATALAERFGATTWHVPFDDLQPRVPHGVGTLVDLDGGLYREFEPYRGRFVLVRPDRFTSAVWTPDATADVARAADAVRPALDPALTSA